MSGQDEQPIPPSAKWRHKVDDSEVRPATLLRSILVCRPTDPKDKITQNVGVLRESSLEFPLPEDEEVLRCVYGFVDKHDHAPSAMTVADALKRAGKISAFDRVESILTEPLVVGGDYAHLVEVLIESSNAKMLRKVFDDARVAAVAGLEIPEGRKTRTIRGVAATAQYVIEQVHDLASPPLPANQAGVVRGQDGAAEYLSDEGSVLGACSGIMQPDVATGGARPGELWLHAAYSGHLKTTLALNWAYNQAVGYQKDVLYYSLEMPYRQVRRWLLAMHSFHSKFEEARIALNLPSGANRVGLDYKSIRDKELSPAEQQFYLDYVIPDWDDPDNGYGKIIVEVADPSKPDITVDALRARAEHLYRKTPFGSVFIDHGSLLGAKSKYASTTDRLNESMRDLKRTATDFRRGQGIPVVALFQTNREGLKEAKKLKEKGELPTYEITSLSYSNEAERSADVVTATYLDKEYASRNRALLTCLKSRDNAPFDPCLLEIKWPCRRLRTCLESPLIDTSTQVGPGDSDVVATLDSIH